VNKYGHTVILQRSQLWRRTGAAWNQARKYR